MRTVREGGKAGSVGSLISWSTSYEKTQKAEQKWEETKKDELWSARGRTPIGLDGEL